MVKENSKIFISRLAISTIILIIATVFKEKSFAFPLFLGAYIIAGYDVLISMVKGLIKAKLFDENFLMGIASLGAFIIGEQTEAVAVLIFYGIGEYFQGIAVSRSRKNISELMDIRPDYANIMQNGKLVAISPEKINIGTIIIVKPGERVPLDGKIIKGSSSLDTSALTGESMPRDVSINDAVLSGAININGLIEVETTATFKESTVSKIMELVENASTNKAESEKFITKFAKVYTPAVVISAVFVALIPPILGLGEFKVWLYRALNFLIISCPCALVLSIPMSFFGGIGGAARQGILIKGGNFLEALNQVKNIIFDKTGTLTHGNFTVAEVVTAEGITKDELLKIAAICEKHSTHPIAQSIIAYCGNSNIPDYNIEEIAGKGIKATSKGDILLAGNIKLMEEFNISVTEKNEIYTLIYIAKNGKYMGTISVGDTIKENAAESIKTLKLQGIENIVMLTGDKKEVAEKIAHSIGINKVKSDLLPQDKVSALEEILHSSKDKTIFVGDGINDAPVLTRADIGIAMGGIGSDAAIEAADIVIMNDDLKKVPLALKIAQKTRKIVMQNIVFALGVKGLILILSVFGITSIWFAIFADVGVALIAILNATRVIRIKAN